MIIYDANGEVDRTYWPLSCAFVEIDFEFWRKKSGELANALDAANAEIAALKAALNAIADIYEDRSACLTNGDIGNMHRIARAVLKDDA